MPVTLFDDFDYMDPDAIVGLYRSSAVECTDPHAAMRRMRERDLRRVSESVESAVSSIQGAPSIAAAFSVPHPGCGEAETALRAYPSFSALLADLMPVCGVLAVTDDHGELRVTLDGGDRHVSVCVRALPPEFAGGGDILEADAWQRALKLFAALRGGSDRAWDERIELCTLKGAVLEGEPCPVIERPATFENLCEIAAYAQELWDAGRASKYLIAAFDGREFICLFRPDRYGFVFPEGCAFTSERAWRADMRYMLEHREVKPCETGMCAALFHRIEQRAASLGTGNGGKVLSLPAASVAHTHFDAKAASYLQTSSG